MAAAVIVAGALWMDLRGTPTELRPFARASIEAGTRIDDDLIEFRNVPVGLLPEVTPGGFAITAIGAGEPLTPALLTDNGPLPDGWWALEMDVPDGAVPGTELRLVVEGSGTVIPAVVVAAASAVRPGGWTDESAMVAIPAETATTVAAAVSHAGVSVLIVEW